MRFSIRALLIFVAIVGGPLALYAHRINENHRQESIAKSLKRFPGFVRFYEVEEDAWIPCRRVEKICLGGRGFTVEDLKLVASLRHVSSVRIGNSEVTDESLALLKDLPYLSELSLGNSPITDNGMLHLGELDSLKELLLYNTKITDASVPHLEKMVNLEMLSIRDTAISERGRTRLRTSLPKCKIRKN